MSQFPITELDFFQIKDQFKTYLKSQAQFKDYNFDGSNMSVLLDILSYNTYQNNFYTNMAISEMFLDSASTESSVLSHAKELNYLPTSTVSAKAQVDLNISASSAIYGAFITIPEKTKFTTVYNGVNYNFYTADTYIARRVFNSDRYVCTGLDIFEGEVVSENRYITDTNSIISLSNADADISSIKVFVNDVEYIFRSNIFGVNTNDYIFYIEPSLDGNYAISFGNNKFGNQPLLTDKITINYRVSSGATPNGAIKFSTAFMSGITVSTTIAALGGQEKENLDSIKYFAPKSIQTQERAVTSSDYEILLKKQFGGSTIKSVSVYGGDEIDPPRYGKVVISVNFINGTSISQGFKNSIINFLSDKMPLPMKPIFIDPDYLYAKLIINLYYSSKNTSKSASELEILVRNAIINYNNTYLDDFGVTLQLSRLSSVIDSLDSGIMNNTIQANPIIDYSPPAGYYKNPSFNFNTPLIIPYTFNETDNIANYTPAIKSSVYIYNGVESFFQDDGNGNLITLSNNLQTVQVLSRTTGSVDYTTGSVRLINFIADSYTGAAINIFANTQDKNIVSPKSRVFSIRDSDVTVNMIEIK